MTATILNPRPISLYAPSDFSQLTPMSERQQWINWIAKPGKDGKTLKIPSRGRTPDGEPVPINAHEPGNWKGLAEALAHVGPESFSGVGYVTSIQDNVVGGDVDGCVHNGVIDPLVLEMLRQFNTRTELSPSGNGVRFWFTVADKQALLPHLQHKRLRGLGPYEIEMYGYGQFLTVTGNIVLNFPMTVNDATAALEALYANHPHSHGIVQDVDWDDQPITTRSREEVLSLALRNEKFKVLHETGDAARAGVGLNQAGEADQSRAEFFYFSTLLKHAENDPRLTLDLYRRSGLYRDKANDWRDGIPYDQYSVSRTLARQLADSPPTEAPSKPSGLPDWPETPTPLGQVNVAVPHLTADMLPPAFAAYVIDEAERLNVYPEHIAVPLMTALSIVVGTRLAIRPKAKDAWYEHPNLWGCVVAPPGSRKSDAIRVGLAPLNLLVQEAQHAYQQAMTEYAPVAEAFKSRMDAYKGEHKAAIKKKDKERQAEIEQEWATLGSLNPPIERRYMTQDATPEALLLISS